MLAIGKTEALLVFRVLGGGGEGVGGPWSTRAPVLRSFIGAFSQQTKRDGSATRNRNAQKSAVRASGRRRTYVLCAVWCVTYFTVWT